MGIFTHYSNLGDLIQHRQKLSFRWIEFDDDEELQLELADQEDCNMQQVHVANLKIVSIE